MECKDGTCSMPAAETSGGCCGGGGVMPPPPRAFKGCETVAGADVAGPSKTSMAHGLARLVASLTTGTEKAKNKAARDLYALIAQQTTLRACAVEEGALPPLVTLLQTGSDKAKRYAAWALCQIACESALCVRLSEAGAVPPLVALLQTGCDEAKRYAVVALGNIACDDSALCMRVVEAGAVPPLVALLQTGSDKAKRYAAWALCQIACESALCVRLSEAGAVPPLVALLQTGSDEGKVGAAQALRYVVNESSARPKLLASGAVLHLAALCADPHAPQEAKDWGQEVLDELCTSRADLQRAVGETMAALWPVLHAQAKAAKVRAAQLRALADGAGESGSAHCDVTFKCADGVDLGASRLLLVQTCPYYRSLFESGSAEAASGMVVADADFSSAAHAALLRQLHSLGEAALSEEADGVLELLKLAAKLQPPTGAAADAALPLQGVISRCEAAIIGGLDVSNCLDVLLHVKAGGSFPRIVEAAEALVKDRLDEVVAQPRWLRVVDEFPRDAAQLLQSVALQMRRDRAKDAGPSKRQRVGDDAV